MIVKQQKVLFIPDVHCPYQDSVALEALYSFMNWWKPDTVIILGDLVDFYSLSSYNKDPKRALQLQKELDQSVQVLKDIRDRAPKAKISFIKGNHESVKWDTEILTKNGWKIADSLEYDDEVASFKNGKITFDNPIKITKGKIAPIWSVKGNMTEEYVSDKHRIFVNNQLKNVKEFSRVKENSMVSSGYYSGKRISLDISPEEMKFVIWLICDGCIVKRGKGVHHLQFKLSRQDKIDNLKKLLENLNIKYTIHKSKKTGINILQPYIIRIYSKDAKKYASYLSNNKTLKEEYIYLFKEYVDKIIEGIMETDGSDRGFQKELITINKKNVDILQRMLILNNINCKILIVKNRSGFNNGKIQYKLTFKEKLSDNFYNKIKNTGKDDYVVSITTKDDTIITRRNGKVAFTGNSRLKKYLWSNSKELNGLRALQLEKLLEFDRFNIKYHDNGRMKFKGLIIKHGNVIRKYSGYTAKAEFEKNGTSGVSGHTHRLSMYRQTNENDAYVWVESGCLCKLNAEYLNGETPNWHAGFSVGYFKKNSKRFLLETVPIIKGKAMYGGQEFN